MPVRTSRTSEDGTVRVDHDRCKLCGMCVRVCKEGPLRIERGRLLVDYSCALGCVACGHCAAVCPEGCITVEGRDLRSDDILPLPPKEARAGFEQLNALMVSRRSMREYEAREVEQEMINKILDAAATAPMGIPPSDVGVLVFRGRDKVREFTRDMLDALKTMRRVFSPPAIYLWRLFIGKDACDMMRTFLVPLIDKYLKANARGEDLFAYDAPLGTFFYGAPGADPTDAVISATYAMLAAESLGLGSCMLGFPAPTLAHSRKLRAKYGIPAKARMGIMLIFGYPALTFRRAIKRRFASVRYW